MRKKKRLTLGQYVRAAREGGGYTLRSLEKLSGVSGPLISQIETGRVWKPGFWVIVKLAQALGLKLDDLAQLN